MTVLIKGMEMPKSCGKCKMHFLAEPNYVCCSITDRIPKIVGEYANSRVDLDYRIKSIESIKIPSWCPLEEVPEPHGKLIDADALQKEWDEIPDYYDALDVLSIENEVFTDAPIVIDAESVENTNE